LSRHLLLSVKSVKGERLTLSANLSILNRNFRLDERWVWYLGFVLSWGKAILAVRLLPISLPVGSVETDQTTGKGYHS
jgi:hypothetical protein